MRFYINILTTYFPDLNPPYDVYYEQILEQVQLAEELGWECFMFNEHHFLGYGGLAAKGLIEAGIDPKKRYCQFHVRTHVNESSVRAQEIGRAAISRYDEISRIGRKSLTVAPADYDWNAMLAAGRNLYDDSRRPSTREQMDS
ncbi:MAG: hypothetical protein WD688_02700 [Candidatus Binatia bacterium]